MNVSPLNDTMHFARLPDQEWYVIPDSKVHGANMGPTWVLSSPGGPHGGPMNLAIWDVYDALQKIRCDIDESTA